MKQASNLLARLTLVLWAILMGTTLALPIAVQAATETDRQSPFCTILAKDIDKINTPLSSLKGKLLTARQDQVKKITDDRTKIDEDIQTNRDKADTKRQTNFTKLEDKGNTDAQKAAITTYQNAIKSAINTRRAAYDAAKAAFRSGVDAAIAGRKTTADAQITAYTNAVNAAIATAQASCAADSSLAGGQVIRTTFMASLKTARQNFQSARKDDSTVGSQVRELAKTRNAAFKAADETFKASTAAARTALKAAFGTDASSID